MNKNQIFKIYGTDYLQMTKEILEESGLADMIEKKDGQIGIKPNLVSFHVEKLVQEEYLIREAIPGDRRQVKLILTEKADVIVEKGRKQKCFWILPKSILKKK